MIDLCVAPVINTMSIADAAYVAGLIDGEGCITMVCQAPAKRSRAKSDLHYVLVTITNTHIGIMEWLQEVVGGRAANRTEGTKSQDRMVQNNWKDRYEWRVTGKKAYALLEQIEPYLVIKKEQCKIALAMRDLGQWSSSNGCTSEVLLAQRQKLMDEIRLLNKKGRT